MSDDYKEDPFKVLGVSKDADEKEIKKAYRKLALQHHPDRQGNDEDRRRAQAKFASISHAYEILMDDALRQEYEEACGVSSSGKVRTRPTKPFKPVFNDPYEVFQKDFLDLFGFEYPGAEYDWVEPEDWDPAPGSHAAIETEKQKKAAKKAKKEKKSKKKESKDKKDVKLSSSTDIVVRDNGQDETAIVKTQGINNRPISMETEMRKEGTIETTTHTLVRPDGTVETVTMRTGIPGNAPNKKKQEQLKMIEGEKPKKLLTNGEQPKTSNKGKKPMLLANESHTNGKPRRGLFGFGKKQ